jgi:aminobutyraldehyde dehydrogenase
MGNPADDDAIEMGPLISATQRDRVAGYVTRASDAGARMALGGDNRSGPGFFFSPTILTDVKQDAEIIQREVFGPVITVQSFDDELDALVKANDSEYGLCASVWTGDASRALRVSRALDFGTVWINSHLVLASELPWGGYKQSGYGTDMSALTLDAYTRVKHVMARFD